LLENAFRWFATRKTVSLGLDINLQQEGFKAAPHLVLELGMFNALDGYEDGDNGLIVNVGFNIDTPSFYK